MAHDREIGVVAPDFLLDKTLKMVRGGAAVKPDELGLVKAIAAATSRAGLNAAIVDRVRIAIASSVLPALARQVEELQRHRAVANGNPGVWDLADGEAYYRWTLKAATTSNRSPQDIHTLGASRTASSWSGWTRSWSSRELQVAPSASATRR